MEENREEIVSDTYIHNALGSTLSLKGKQMDKHTHTHTLTGNQYCSCRKIVNVKRQKWIMLMAWLTVVFNIMISNSRKIDYITSSLFTWWKKIYWPVVLKDKHKEKLQLLLEQEQDTSKLYVVLVRKSTHRNLFILKCSRPHQTKWYAFEVK